MRILSRCLVESFLLLFIAILASSILTIAIVELMLKPDDIVDRYPGFAGIVRYMTLRIPSYYLSDLIPIVAFAAAFSVGQVQGGRE